VHEGSTPANTEELQRLRREVALYQDVLQKIDRVCEEAAKGNLEPRLIGFSGGGVLQRIGERINSLLDSTDAFVREAGASLSHASKDKFFRRMVLTGMSGSFRKAALIINKATEAMADRKRALDEATSERLMLAQDFERTVQGVITSVAHSAEGMKSTATSLATTAGNSSDQVNAVASASEETSASVRSVAAAVEQLVASIGEISRQSDETVSIASEAMQQAQKTNVIVDQLSAASKRIGGSAQVITKIAGTTNLLALNAAIEAARAGDLGKGFAVVASEVKDLANQTTHTTEEISDEIAAIQKKTDEAVGAISAILKIIGRVHDISSTTSTAVAEQRTATSEISSNVHQAAIATQEVAQNVAGMTRSVQQTSEAASMLLSSADKLTGEAKGLNDVAGHFLQTIRGE